MSRRAKTTTCSAFCHARAARMDWCAGLMSASGTYEKNCEIHSKNLTCYSWSPKFLTFKNFPPSWSSRFGLDYNRRIKRQPRFYIESENRTADVEGTRFLEKLDIGTNVLSFGIKKLLNNLLDHELPSRCRRLAAQSGREERWMVAGWFVQYIFLFFFFSSFFFISVTRLTGQCFKGVSAPPLFPLPLRYLRRNWNLSHGRQKSTRRKAMGRQCEAL